MHNLWHTFWEACAVTMFKHYLYAVLQWLNSPSLEVSPTQWQRNKNTIGGGGGSVRGCKAANYPREASVCKGSKLGGPTLGPTNPKLDSCMCLVCKSNKLALFGNYDSIPNLMCSTSFHFCILKSWYTTPTCWGTNSSTQTARHIGVWNLSKNYLAWLWSVSATSK